MKSQKKFWLIGLVVIFSFVSSLNAQVTIGALTDPDPQAVLDLQSGGNKGLLLPRVALTGVNSYAPFTSAPVQGMVIYNTGTAIAQGMYSWTGQSWKAVERNWFYMPSIVIDTTDPDPLVQKTVDLYAKYVDQFDNAKVGSPGAPAYVYSIGTKDQFYYYVTGYDENVFQIDGINADGVLTYRVKDVASDSTFMNIVFVRKSIDPNP